MLDFIIDNTIQYMDMRDKNWRKMSGQFFTSKETAAYMAGMFDMPDKQSISILDPGAGSGILSAALIDRLQEQSIVKEIQLVCYENNPDILDLLEQNLVYLSEKSEINISYSIVNENYILSQKENFQANRSSKQFDLIIGNPPYKKIPKNALEALAMPSVCYGAPNLYFLFAAMSLFNLKKNAEMVYIIPRSWTSGLYFKRFREFFLTNGRLLAVHLFTSRDKVFSHEQVLQEIIIIKVRKQRAETDKIRITTSTSNDTFINVGEFTVPYSYIVSGDDMYVYLVTNERDIRILSSLTNLKYTLPKLGFRMKTGITVDFRNRELLRSKTGKDIIPLFYPQHIKDGLVKFPINKDVEYMSDEVKGLIQENKNYLFVKRFTTKEEKRRLQCGIYLREFLPKYKNISTQNKINFIEKIDKTDLDKVTLYGLYVIFNSTLYDSFYRILNGSTQVNSTEVNALPMPSIIDINKMGCKLIESNDLSTQICDSILDETLMNYEVNLMNKIEQARIILKAIGMPDAQQTDLCCYVLLAMSNLGENDQWQIASSEWIRIHDIIQFIKDKYSVVYAENSRETFRKQAIHHFRNAALIEDNGKATNSPNYRYRITEETLALIRNFGSEEWEISINEFLNHHVRLIDIYASKKKMTKMPVKINGEEITFSSGAHNRLQKLIIEEFAPRFAPNSKCLYVGDTIKKDLVKDIDYLNKLGFHITLHDKMPDVVLYKEENNWLYFIESVTSVGPMDPKRILEINEMTRDVKAGKIFVTAFLDFKTYKKFSQSIAWETEIWLAEMPEHMIHMNGDRFLGPR